MLSWNKSDLVSGTWNVFGQSILSLGEKKNNRKIKTITGKLYEISIECSLTVLNYG